MRRSALLFCLLLGSCAVQKIPVPTGGSRSDGTVQMTYEYDLFEAPQVDWVAAYAGARERCQLWDYGDAKPFGGAVSYCAQVDSAGNCLRTVVSKTYQCTGQKPIVDIAADLEKCLSACREMERGEECFATCRRLNR